MIEHGSNMESARSPSVKDPRRSKGANAVDGKPAGVRDETTWQILVQEFNLI